MISTKRHEVKSRIIFIKLNRFVGYGFEIQKLFLPYAVFSKKLVT
jgi:hypothetical protein